MEFPGKVQPVIAPVHLSNSLKVDILRLDIVHPVISGNKWYKLKEHLKDARVQQKNTIVTFGGAFSNHIVATAAACNLFGYKSAGIIRGERPENLSGTLEEAMSYGMQLFFLSRTEYRKRTIPPDLLAVYPEDQIYIVDEGGYGDLGMLGAASILKEADTSSYTHIMTEVGTGTTLAGLIKSSLPYQQIIGISVMKNNFSLEEAVQRLTPDRSNFQILHDFHFGGYAKPSSELINFMNEWYEQTNIPSDFVYTGKMFYAFNQLKEQNYFPEGSRVLLIHSGGLQGNRSLPVGMLHF